MRVSQNHAADRMFVSRNSIGSGKGINKANAIVMSTATEIGFYDSRRQAFTSMAANLHRRS